MTRPANQSFKNSKQIFNIREKALSLKKLCNFFSVKDIKQFRVWMTRCRESHGYSGVQDQTNKVNWTVHPDLDMHEEMNLFFQERVTPLIANSENFEIKYKFAFHGNFSGYGIHTDAGYNPTELIYQQGIIPLSILPKNSNVHTVIMDQQCFHSSSFPCIQEDQQLQKHVFGLDYDSQQTFDLYDQYWENTDFRKKQMNGFTIQYPFLWEIGSTVIWNRSYIHCSSDFSTSGTDYKEGLMWISELKPKS